MTINRRLHGGSRWSRRFGAALAFGAASLASYAEVTSAQPANAPATESAPAATPPAAQPAAPVAPAPAKPPARKPGAKPRALSAPAQAPDVEMFVGETRVLPEPNAGRLAVGNGAVLSAAVLDDREILLIANAPGSSSLHIWQKNGRSRRVAVNVLPGDMGRLHREIIGFFSGIANLRVRAIGDKIVVEGDNLSDDDKFKVEEIAKRYPQVINFTGRVGWERMVHMDVKVIEFSKNALRDLGVNWSVQNRPFFYGAALGTIYNNNKEGRPLSGALQDNDTQVQVTIPSDKIKPFRVDFGVVGLLFGRLNLLVQNGDAVILAEPQLSCRSGRRASFLAGGEIPYSVATATGTPSVQFRPYGIRLDIEPLADASGAIRAKVATEVSSLDRSVTVLGVPGLLSRKTETEFNVREGETMVLSGVINREQGQDIDKVPLLGDIPVLGHVFKSKRFRDRETELVIFVTPTIVAADTPRLTEQMDRNERRAQDYLEPKKAEPRREPYEREPAARPDYGGS